MKINLCKSFALLLILAGLSGCKIPQTARYSPDWEIKTSVADGELPTPITLDEVTDVPLPSPDDPQSNLIETVDENGVATTQTNGSSVGNPEIANVPLAGSDASHAGPGIERPSEPPIPQEGGPKFGVRIRETLLPTEEELKNAPAAMKVESSLSVTEAAPVRRTPGIAHTMHSVPTAHATGRDPKPTPSPVSAATFAAPSTNPVQPAAGATARSTVAPTLTPDEATFQSPPVEKSPVMAKAPEKPAKLLPTAKVETKAEPIPAPSVAKPNSVKEQKAPVKTEVAKSAPASVEKTAQAKKTTPSPLIKSEDTQNEIANAPLPKTANPAPDSTPTPVSTAKKPAPAASAKAKDSTSVAATASQPKTDSIEPASTPPAVSKSEASAAKTQAPTDAKPKRESANAKSGSDLAEILALAKKVEEKGRPAKSGLQ